MSAMPHRLVLEGVPRLSFFSGGPRCPEDVCLPSVLRVITEYLKDPDYPCAVCRPRPNAMRCAYSHFMGVTGAAFYVSWKDGWHMDNAAPAFVDADALHMEKAACAAMGRSLEAIDYAPENRGEILTAIDTSLKRGMPVISYGLFGPPEAGIIAGYDDDGNTLVGYNFFQGFQPGTETEPSGYYRIKDWAASLRKIVVLGDKGERPHMKDTLRAAIGFGIKAMETAMVQPEPDAPEEYRNRHNGLSAYQAWAAGILDDAFFGEEQSIRTCHQVIDNVAGTLAETRWYGAQFLSGLSVFGDTALHRNSIEDFLMASGLFAGLHKLMWDAWDLMGGIGNPEGWRKLADKDTRRRLADVVMAARDKDARALEHLKSAYEYMPL